MNEKKSVLLFRIVCMLVELVGILLLCVYMYTISSSKAESVNLAVNNNSYPQISNEIQSVSDSVSQTIIEEAANVSSQQPQSRLVGNGLLESVADSISEPASSKSVSSKSVSSKSVSSKPVSSKPVSSKEDIPVTSHTPQLPDLPQSIPPFESDIPSRNEIDNTQNEVNKKRLFALTEKYAVTVTVPEQESGEFSEYVSSYANNSTDIGNAIAQIETALSTFPKDFFSQAATNIALVIVAKTIAEDVLVQDTAIIIPCFKTVSSKLIQSSILNISSKQLNLQLCLDFTPYNPEEFIYGTVAQKYNYSRETYEYACFLSSAAQQNPQADLHSIYMAIFQKTQFIKSVKVNSPFYAKLKYTFGQLSSWSPCLGEIKVISDFS